MRIKHITAEFAVCPQIEVASVRRAVEAGFTTIICNLPDGEAAGQPGSASVARAAADAGADFHYLPIAHGQSTLDEAEKLREILAAGNGPALAYCRSGMRSAALFSASTATPRSAANGASGIGEFLSGLRFPFRGTAAE